MVEEERGLSLKRKFELFELLLIGANVYKESPEVWEELKEFNKRVGDDTGDMFLLLMNASERFSKIFEVFKDE